MTPLDVQCILCGAKAGWHCTGAPGSGRPGRRVPPHHMRIEDAKNAGVAGRPGATGHDRAPVSDGTDIPPVPSAASTEQPPTRYDLSPRRCVSGLLPPPLVLSPTDTWREHAGLGYEEATS